MLQPGAGIPPPQTHHHQQYQQQPLPPQQWMMPPPPQQQQQPQPQQGFQPQLPPHFWSQQPQTAAVPRPLQMQQQQYLAEQMGGSNDNTSLWIGDLQYFMDENYLYFCFAQAGELASVEVIRNKQSGQPEGYGFLEFQSRAAAERVLQTYNGSLMPNSEQTFRLNWATLGAGERCADDGPDYTVFVGDLAADVTDYLLLETFKPHYTSIKGAKVVTDRMTGRTKGYGFVRFGDESEQLRAMSEMNGVLCSIRPMRIGPAATKTPATGQPYQKGHKRLMSEMNGVLCSSRPMRIGPAATKKPATGQPYQKASYQNSQANPGENDPPNTTIFVGGLEENVSDDSLRHLFGQLGELVHVEIPAGKHCGFVQFADRACAEQALSVLNGTRIGGTNVQLSWGRSPNKQAQSDQAQWNNGAYFGYGAQGYEAASGSYLSPRECNSLAKSIFAKDREEIERIIASRKKDCYDDGNYDLSDFMGDEGVQNLDI